MATGQVRTRDFELRLAQGAAEDEGLRRQTFRTPLGVVCRELDVRPLRDNPRHTVSEGTPQAKMYPVMPPHSEGSLGRLPLRGQPCKLTRQRAQR
jgi:hypothetical protein